MGQEEKKQIIARLYGRKYVDSGSSSGCFSAPVKNGLQPVHRVKQLTMFAETTPNSIRKYSTPLTHAFLKE